MNGSAQRACESVATREERRALRRPLMVQVFSPDHVTVDGDQETKLGLSEEQVCKAQCAFAEALTKLAGDLTREVDVAAVPAPAAKGAESLRLDPDTRDLYLDALREPGAYLRSKLFPDLRDRARAFGLAAGGEEEPALTFYERKKPVLWEMMYEGEQAGKANWRLFWGFRSPITHSLIGHPPRRPEIHVRNGLFSAFCEGLGGAGLEVSALVERLQRRIAGIGHSTLGRALRERLAREGHGPSGELDWFRCHLETKNPLTKKQWKRDALTEILKEARSRHEVFHFACYCAPGRRAQLYSCLVMQIGGEPLSLNVSTMCSNLQQPPDAAHHPGPLVFLNACGTGQQDDSGEPPGFPDAWIGFGAVAVIATICPVPDRFALAFADKFYEFLFRGADHPGADRFRYVAEALLATRRHFMEEYDNPLGLAYVLYARMGAHVRCDGPPR
jgi:CHAT domain